ncbi:MAG: CopG family transcriptional regulator [Thermoanaerobaculia bacterium]
MRTTLNLAEDVLLAVKELARREGRSAGEVLSDLARQALTRGQTQGEIAEGGAFYGFEPLPRRGPAISNQLIDRLREDEPD